MTTLQAQNKIEFYTNTFLSVIAKSIKEGLNGLEAGRIALDLLGCPLDVAKQIVEHYDKKSKN